MLQNISGSKGGGERTTVEALFSIYKFKIGKSIDYYHGLFMETRVEEYSIRPEHVRAFSFYSYRLDCRYRHLFWYKLFMSIRLLNKSIVYL